MKGDDIKDKNNDAVYVGSSLHVPILCFLFTTRD